MSDVLAAWVDLVGPHRAVQLFGVRLVGVNAENGRKLLFTLGFVAAVLAASWALRRVAAVALAGRRNGRVTFWTHQALHLFTAVLLAVVFLSTWFDDPARLATFLGLVTAGLAFALQRVVTAAAGYVVILRGNTFNVGDRITMGGVRGDVISLGFVQTTIMEMGQPPAVQDADPAMWVHARQYTGRIVTVTNDKVFDTPIYNYTRDFPYIWEEMRVPVRYTDDRRQAEQILLAAADALTVRLAELAEPVIQEMERRYLMRRADLRPRVYLRLTSNWVELTVRFLVEDHGIRDVKDAMTRRILDELDAAGITVASGTYEVVGMPPVRVVAEPPAVTPATAG